MSELKLRLLSYAPTNANSALLPAFCTLLMAGTAALQLMLPQESTLAPATPAGRPPRWTLAEVGVPAAVFGAEGPSLFSPVRLTDAASEGQTGDAAAATPKPIGPLGGAFVLGSVRIGQNRAVLIRSTDGRVIRIARGSGYRGWRLVSIGDRAATFRLGSQRREFEFGAAPAAPAVSEDSSDSEDPSE